MRSTPLLLLLAACARAPAPTSPAPEAPRLRFEDAGLPAALPALQVRVSPRFTYGDVSGPVRLQRLRVEGEPLGEGAAGPWYGAVTAHDGTPLPGPDGALPWTEDALDFTALIEAEGRLVLTNHVEAAPAGLWVTDLRLGDDGTLTPLASAPVDLRPVRGAKDLCAGDVTPWNTHLGGEEYEPDAARVGPDGRLGTGRPWDRAWDDMARALPPGDTLWPYDHGWMIEATIRADGVDVARHPALGRFSHELGVVLPDRRTVYLSDDHGAGGGLYLFVADRPADLSSGHLYALRWEETLDRERGGTARVGWVSLGHAGADVLAPALAARRLRFDDLLRRELPVDGRCPDGLTLVEHAHTVEVGLPGECLAVRPGADVLASRFETRRVTALRGATTELVKAEGLAWDPDARGVWLAVSEIGGRMTDGHGHVDVAPNPCGAILRLDDLRGGVLDDRGAPIDSDLVATTLRGVLAGVPQGDACHPDGIANPDNLTYLPGSRLLVIAEDTLRHEVPTLWAHETDTGRLVRLATAPTCGEWTGIRWFPDVRGHGWLTVSLQHAFRYGSRCDAGPVPEGEARTWTGVLGPFPRLR